MRFNPQLEQCLNKVYKTKVKLTKQRKMRLENKDDIVKKMLLITRIMLMNSSNYIHALIWPNYFNLYYLHFNVA